MRMIIFHYWNLFERSQWHKKTKAKIKPIPMFCGKGGQESVCQYDMHLGTWNWCICRKKLPRLRRAECTNRVPSPSPKHHCDLIRIGIPSKLKKFEAWVASSYYSRQCAGVYCLCTPFGSRIGYLLTSSSFYHSGLTTNKNALGQTERWMENPQRWCIQVTNFKVEKTNAITGSIEVYKSILRCAHGISHAMPTNHEAIIIVLIFSLNIVALDICSSSQQTSQCCWQ